MKTLQILCILALSTSALVSCVQAPLSELPFSKIIHLPAETLSAPTSTPVRNQPGGQISIKLEYNPSPDKFKTQAACTVSTHLQSFKVYLIDGSTSGLGALGNTVPFISLGILDGQIAAGPFNVNNTIPSSGGSQTITLNNVDTGEYYLAVAAYDGPNGTGTNITSSTSLVSSLGSISSLPIALTDAGGNTTNPGRVEIGVAASNFPIINSTEPTLSMTLELDNLICS
mgnify:CR=1 FL=1